MKVFISRDCNEHSVFRKILTEKGISVDAESLVDFSAVDFQLPESFDWIFFYSRRAVSYFYSKKPALSPKVKKAAIGPGTAAEILQNVPAPPDFIGDGNPETTAAAFKKVVLGQTVLFVRAEESKKSIQNLLSRELTVLELIAYKNVPKTDIIKSDADVLVFTSSLNAEAYLKKYSPEKNQQIAAIGKPTFETMALMGFMDVFCADSPDEASLANLVLKIFENNKP